MTRLVTWGLGGLALAGLAVALTSGGDELDDGDQDDDQTDGNTMTRKGRLYAKLQALPQLDEDQRLFVMLVAYGETGGSWKASAHNDTPSEVAASAAAWDANPTLAGKLVALGYSRDDWAIGSGGYGGRLAPYFADDMFDAGILPVKPSGLFDENLSIVSTILTAHKLQQWKQWRDGPQTMGALRAGYWGPGAMDSPPADRIEKYRRHAEKVGLPSDFIDRMPAEFPGASASKAIFATLKGAVLA